MRDQFDAKVEYLFLDLGTFRDSVAQSAATGIPIGSPSAKSFLIYGGSTAIGNFEIGSNHLRNKGVSRFCMCSIAAQSHEMPTPIAEEGMA